MLLCWCIFYLQHGISCLFWAVQTLPKEIQWQIHGHTTYLLPESFMDPLLMASQCHLPKGLCVLDHVCRNYWGVGLKETLHFARVAAQEVEQSVGGRRDLSEQGPLLDKMNYTPNITFLTSYEAKKGPQDAWIR